MCSLRTSSLKAARMRKNGYRKLCALDEQHRWKMVMTWNIMTFPNLWTNEHSDSRLLRTTAWQFTYQSNEICLSTNLKNIWIMIRMHLRNLILKHSTTNFSRSFNLIHVLAVLVLRVDMLVKSVSHGAL